MSFKEYYCKNDSGFFGSYYLLDKKPSSYFGLPFFGVLTIYITDHPWRADSKNEDFIMLELFTRKICIWDSIGVGTSIATLNSFIKDYKSEKNGDILITNFGNYNAEFKMSNGKILELMVKIKCK